MLISDWSSDVCSSDLQTIFMARGKADADFPLARRDAVLDRILDDRLQDQDGHTGIFQVLRNIDIDLKPVGKPRLLDVEIKALEGDFLVKADRLFGVDSQCRAQEGRQVDRQSLVWGKSVCVRVDLGGRRTLHQ